MSSSFAHDNIDMCGNSDISSIFVWMKSNGLYGLTRNTLTPLYFRNELKNFRNSSDIRAMLSEEKIGVTIISWFPWTKWPWLSDAASVARAMLQASDGNYRDNIMSFVRAAWALFSSGLVLSVFDYTKTLTSFAAPIIIPELVPFWCTSDKYNG